MRSDDCLCRPFLLSAILKGHTNDVRSLSSSSSTLFSGSRDTTARSWDRSSSREWSQMNEFSLDPTAFVNSVCYLPSSLASPSATSKGSLIVGSQSGVIALYNLDFPTRDPEILLGHRMNVCALHATGDRIVSGSWDGTGRVWTRLLKELSPFPTSVHID